MKNNWKKLLIGSSLFMALTLAGCNTTPSNVDPATEDETQEEEDKTVAVTGVAISKESLSMNIGGTYTLLATISPAKATNKKVTWSSSNEDVVSVDGGVVTALALGEARITVTTEDGGFTAHCDIEVIEEVIHADGVSLNYDEYAMKVGGSVTLVETISPYNATNHNVTWESSDPEVVSVTNGTIKGLAAGSATITVTTEDGGYTATCAVTVTAKTDDDGYDPAGRDDVIMITEAGEYDFSGEYNKQIYVNIPEEDSVVVLNFNGATLTYGENSPIYVATVGDLEISAKKGTTNVINDTRLVMSEEDDEQGKGAIYVADGDLKLKGKGSLTINAGYNNGIHGKDDVKIQNLTLEVTAPNNAVKGNDSLKVDAATLKLHCGNDAMKTENSDVKVTEQEDGTTKTKQRGDIEILEASIEINSLGDGITASHDVIIGDTDVEPKITIKTDKYSDYEGQTVEVSENKFYIEMSSSYYERYSSYKFGAYINDTWYDVTYAGSKKTSSDEGWGGGWRPGPGGGDAPGGSTTTYIYEADKPEGAAQFELYMFNNGASYSTSNYVAKGSATFNANYDMVSLSRISTNNKSITFGGWSAYENSLSSKGIKAENVVYIKNGTIDIESLDDGIHANNDGSLENGEKPLGNIEISGGIISVATGDDGLHADSTLNITGGSITVSDSYEALEGNIIKMSGGEAYVYATDDAVNAGDGNSTPLIQITGGYLDLEVLNDGKDRDGLDSNGNYTQSGGVVIIKGPSSSNGAAALDADGTVTVSGGTLIVFGGIERTPSTSGVTKTVLSGSYATGTRTITYSSASVSYTTTLRSSNTKFSSYSVNGTATVS